MGSGGFGSAGNDLAVVCRFVSPEKSCVENLMTEVILLGGGTLGR